MCFSITLPVVGKLNNIVALYKQEVFVTETDCILKEVGSYFTFG